VHVRTLVYAGPREISVEDVPDARIERPNDVLVRITATHICGSDLHMYEGRTTMETGRILGHDNLGIVVETGDGVERVKVGDRVCLPFNVGCGFCDNCERGLTGFCLSVDSDTPGDAYGFATPTVRRSTCACRGATSTAWSCRRTRRRRRTTT
jgi:glutathione-independent formaldehyde dehydrogenase